MSRLVVLIDGEHYPPLVRSVIAELRESHEVVGAVFAGGTEKIGASDPREVYGLEVETGPNRLVSLGVALDRWKPDAVLDLSDEPVVTAADRFRLATVALIRGVTYMGADFELRPAQLPSLVSKASIRIIATGKRTGKTAVAGALARHAVAAGRRPIIVAMGRGGPNPPAVVEVSADVSPQALIALADAGHHAASDYLEDAVTARVPTIGCRRVGGGLAGAVGFSNVGQGAQMAEARDEDLVIFEGSGAAIPPVATRAGMIVIPAWSGPDAVNLYLGPYRVLLADVAIVTMAEDPADAEPIRAAVKKLAQGIETVAGVFRPKPLSDVKGCSVFFCTTAPERVSTLLSDHLSNIYGCEVVGMSNALADRNRLTADLASAPDFEVLLTEIKAGGVEVAARAAAKLGRRIVLADNELIGEGVADAFDHVIALATRD